jgi:multidrug resistance efflux pump
VAFREGQMVNKGDFLALVDPRPYQNALEQAQGQLAKDQALLSQAQADLARYRPLPPSRCRTRNTWLPSTRGRCRWIRPRWTRPSST